MYKLICVLNFVVLSSIASANGDQLTLIELKKIGLDEADGKRYSELINIKGLVEKDIIDDPILVLGVYAETDEQRAKFAELYYHREIERANRVSRFMEVYQTVFDENSAGQQLLNDLLAGSSNNKQSTGFKNTKLVIFSTLDCDSCGDYVQRIQTQIKIGWVKGIDVYFSDNPTADQVNDWASQYALDVDLVRQRKITLNIDSSLQKNLGIVGSGKVYVRIGDTLSELTLKDSLGLFK